MTTAPARQSATRRHTPRPAPELPPAEVDRFVSFYLRDRARWQTAPRAAEVRARLARAHRRLNEAAEALGDLLPDDLRLAGIDETAAHDLFDALRNTASVTGSAVEDLDGRGAANGGASLHYSPEGVGGSGRC
jgi:hypothetical protein